MMRNDWVEVHIDELITNDGIFSDGDWVESKDQDPNGEVRLIQLADIGDGVFRDKSNRHLTFKKSVELNCTYLQAGDILLARMPEPLGRAAVFPLKGENRYVTVVDVAIIRPSNKYIDTKFLLYNINSPFSRKNIEEFQSGTTRKRISRKNLSRIEFPLAPLPEQRAIVGKIEQLFSELDNGINNLKSARDKLEIYRQAVLKKAFEGELTREWREGNSTSISSLEQEQESNRTDRLHRVRLGDLCHIVGGVTKGRKLLGKETIELPYLRVANVQDGYLDLSVIKFIRVLPSDLKKYHLEYDDILFTEGGDKDKLGRGTLWKNEVDNCIHQNHVFRARINNKSEVLPAFITYYAQSPEGKDYFFKHGKQTTNLASINKTILSNLPLPLPKLKEQQAIVEAIESRLSICDKISESIDQSLEKAEALRQSILKKAFSGKLLSEIELEACRQESDWEPAEKLLERIKNEKSEEAKKKK